MRGGRGLRRVLGLTGMKIWVDSLMLGEREEEAVAGAQGAEAKVGVEAAGALVCRVYEEGSRGHDL